MAFIVTRPIEIEPLLDAVRSAECGGIAMFLGTVRDHHAGRGVSELDYSAYLPMAERALGDIVTEAEARWPVRVAVEHRIGLLSIGDVAVAVAVAGAHRDEAFTACRYIIEEVKRRVPVWKHERYADGTESWVDPTGGLAPSERMEPDWGNA